MDAVDGERPRTLVIFPGALGDLICLLPTLSAIAERHPESQLCLMARFELARFAVGRTPVARAFSMDRPDVAQLFTPSAAPRFFRNFTRIYSFFAGDNEQFRRSLEAAARDVRFLPFRPHQEGHIAEAYLRAIDAPRGQPCEPRVTPLPEDVAAARAVLERRRLAARTFLMLLPGSGSRAKNWPVESFVELARRLSPELRSLCVLGPAEAGLASVFRAAGIETVDGLELGVVAALATQAAAFLGNDSGVSHLAAAAGAPGVALFGPTDPSRWRPLGVVRVLSSVFMAKLSVDEVVEALTCQSRSGAVRIENSD